MTKISGTVTTAIFGTKWSGLRLGTGKYRNTETQGENSCYNTIALSLLKDSFFGIFEPASHKQGL